MKTQKGITLIALVITIIVMLILVGVTVTAALNGGLFKTAKDSSNKTQQEFIREEIKSVLPQYYTDTQIDKKEIGLEEFLKKSLNEDITNFGEVYNDNEELEGYHFNYKNFGFQVDLKGLSLTSLENPIANKKYEIITSIDELESGKSYLIVSSKTLGTAYTMGEPTTNNIKLQEIKILPNITIEYSQKDYDYALQQVEVESEDNVSYAWQIYNKKDNKYCYISSSAADKNYLKTADLNTASNPKSSEEQIENRHLFSISFGENDNVVISGFNTVLETRSIRFNSSNKIFSSYTSGKMKDIYLFKCID